MTNAQSAQHAPWVPRSSFASRLLLLRHELGLSQREAAARCELDDGSWSNWENGSHPRNMAQVVEAIHHATGVDRAWLMWGTAPTAPPGNVRDLRSRPSTWDAKAAA